MMKLTVKEQRDKRDLEMRAVVIGLNAQERDELDHLHAKELSIDLSGVRREEHTP